MGFDLADKVATLSQDQLLRIDLVNSEQLRLGMIPRNDSLLTYNFAIGNVPPYFENPETVAREIYVVSRIYDDTMYGQLIESVMRKIANHVHYKYKLEWGDTWEIVRFYVPSMLKFYCVKKRGLVF